MDRIRPFLALLCLSIATAGGASALDRDITRKPWSEISVGVASRSSADEYDVLVVAIDGSMEFEPRRIYAMAPGFHYLELASTKVGRGGELTSQPFAIEAKPCIRYELVAIHTDRMSNRRWRPTVKRETPIRSCQEKFGLTPSDTAPAEASAQEQAR